MISGSKVINANVSSSRLLFTVSQLQQTFDTTVGADHMCAMVTNGDGGATEAHIEGSTFVNGELRAVLDRSISGQVRINYLIFCWE